MSQLRRNDPAQYDGLADQWWEASGGFAALHWLAASRAEHIPQAPGPDAVLVDLACGGGLMAPHASRLGYRHVGWDVEVYEWDPGRSSHEVADRAAAGVAAHGDGAIVLLHTWPDPVAPALAAIVERLRAEGATFVRVDALELADGLSPVASPRPAVPAPAG